MMEGSDETMRTEELQHGRPGRYPDPIDDTRAVSKHSVGSSRSWKFGRSIRVSRLSRVRRVVIKSAVMSSRLLNLKVDTCALREDLPEAAFPNRRSPPDWSK